MINLEIYRGETKDKINYSEYVELENQLQDFLYGNEVFESLEKLFVKALEYNQKIFAIGD